VRSKGKLIKWNAEKAFGFILPNAGGVHVFMHKSALFNTKRTPHINDMITFSISKHKREDISQATPLFG
jgi:cold shock CspA family protein